MSDFFESWFQRELRIFTERESLWELFDQPVNQGARMPAAPKAVKRAINLLTTLQEMKTIPAQYEQETTDTIAALKRADARTRLDPSARKRKPAKRSR